MPRGGSRPGAGGRFKWNHGKTKTIRVPEVLADAILEYAKKLDDSVIIDHVTRSKVIDLSGVTIRAFRSGSGVYLKDLLRSGFDIKPESLALSVRRDLDKDVSLSLKQEINDAINNL